MQGPFLFQPAPRELDGEDVERATDIFLLGSGNRAGSPEEDDQDAKEGRKSDLTVLGVVFEDGKVDLCLEVEKMEALWIGRQVGCSSTSCFLRCRY